MQHINEAFDNLAPRMAQKNGQKALNQPMMPSDEADCNSDSDVMSSDEVYMGKPGVPEPVPCEFCGALRYHKGIKLCGRIIWAPYGPERCTCQGALAAYEKEQIERAAEEEAQRKAEADYLFRKKIERIIGESGMGERFLRRTFDTFQATDSNHRTATAAKRYADNFDRLLPKRGQPEPGRNGLFISGPPGTGKTHLAAAIANHLIAQGRPVICMTAIDLLERIKRTFSRSDDDEGSILSIYKTVPLLVIDDIGKEQPTEWAISTIYNIINGRYEAYLPTIVTTNYDTDTLITRMTAKDSRDDTTAKATIDRLIEMCKGVALTGESWRSR